MDSLNVVCQSGYSTNETRADYATKVHVIHVAAGPSMCVCFVKIVHRTTKNYMDYMDRTGLRSCSLRCTNHGFPATMVLQLGAPDA